MTTARSGRAGRLPGRTRRAGLQRRHRRARLRAAGPGVRGLAWLGVELDAELNLQATGDAVMAIHAPGSRVEVWVVPTDEGRVAAQEAARLI